MRCSYFGYFILARFFIAMICEQGLRKTKVHGILLTMLVDTSSLNTKYNYPSLFFFSFMQFTYTDCLLGHALQIYLFFFCFFLLISICFHNSYMVWLCSVSYAY